MKHRKTAMNDLIGKQNMLRQYLLGILADDADQARIEKQLMTDDEFAAEVSLAENDVIEDYLDGGLTADESARFNRYFLASSGRKRQLRLTQNLRRFSARVENDAPHPERSFFDWIPTLSVQRLRFAALVCVIAALGIIVWRFAIYQSDADKGLAQLRNAYRGQRPLEPRITALPDYVPFSETRGPQPALADPAARDRAERYLLDATHDSADAKSHHALALLYLSDKKYDRAVREFDLALRLSPNDASLQSDAGSAYLEMGKNAADDKSGAKTFELLNESLKHLDLAISLAPEMPEPRFNRALCFQALMAQEQAKTAWREYLELDSNSKWAEEARRNLQSLEANPIRDRSAAELESDFLEALRNGNEAEAARLLSGNRELIREKYLPQRLAMSYLGAPEERRDELLRALQYTGRIEMKLTGDPFANEIARFYSTLPKNRIELVKQAQAHIRSGYEKCLGQDYETALDEFQKARTLFKQAGDSWEEALAGYFVGYALVNVDRAGEGMREFVGAAEFAKSRDFFWLEATATHWIAGGYAKLKDHTKAKESFGRALSLAEKINDSYAIQRNLVELAVSSSIGGQKQVSLNYLFRVLQESNRPGRGLRQRYRNLSQAFSMLTDAKLFNAAKMIALEAVSLAEISGDQMWLVEAPGQAGTAFTHTGEFDKARSWLNHSTINSDKIPYEATRKKMTAYAALMYGDLERQTANYREAERYYSAAIDYYDKMQMPYYLEAAHTGRLKSLLALGRNEELERQIPENIKITEELRNRILDEQERTGFFSSRESVYDIAADFEHKRGNFERAYDYAEMSSSRSLLDWLQKGATVTVFDKTQTLLLSDNATPVGLGDIRQRMPAAVQIVQYSVLDDKVLIWIVSKEKFEVRAVAVKDSDFEVKIKRFSQIVTKKTDAADAELEKLSHELYDVLIRPISDHLDPDKELCLIPSKVLFNLPFAALVSPGGRPLTADFSIVYSPSANVFLHCSENAQKKATLDREVLLAVGNPAFDRKKFNDLPDLGDAGTEVREVAALYKYARSLERTKATKAAFIATVADAEVIHFAGHYVVAPEAPMSSYLLFAKEGKETEHSMLTNLELAGRKLTRAKLIVLAACRTGIESYYDGEGMIGLSRTFLAAEVPLVVASQWSVDTEATAVLMKRFHHFRRQKRMTTTASLRSAQLEMLNDPSGRFNDPYYWAAFAVFGGHADF